MGEEQRAYRINLYNPLTVAVVLTNYPLRSIQDISSGIFTTGPWKKKLFENEGEALSLDDINHPRGVKVDSDGDLLVSSIYIWFNDDFGGDEGVVRHLKRYAEPPLANALKKTSAIDDDHYDWMLNSLVPVQTKKKKGVRLGARGALKSVGLSQV